MASAIIHICVAKKVNEKLKMDENLLFLGAIAPDISKEIGTSKNESHFIDNNLDIPNINKFLIKYQNEIKNPFEMGYLIHLLTDYYWYKYFFNNYVTNTKSVNLLNGSSIILNEENIRKLIYQDYTNINIALIDEYAIELSLFSNEINYPSSKIDEIPMDKINIIIEKMGIIIKNSQDDKTIIFDMKEIIEFIENTTVKIINKLFPK